MRFFAIIAVVGLAVAGCTTDDNAENPITQQAKFGPAKTPLVGSYYQGDGLGYNLHLTLEQDGGFDCQWAGCLGNYGSTSGTWSQNGDRIIVNAMESNGMFTDRPLGDMAIIQHDGESRLLRDKDAELLKDEPDMVPFFSFGHVETENGRTNP